MTKLRDAAGIEHAQLAAMADFREARVLEVGCGEGRLTFGYAPVARSVLAIDPDAARIATAKATLPPDLAGRVRFAAAGIEEQELPPAGFDIALLPWSL
jgi:predicted RNA methylase